MSNTKTPPRLYALTPIDQTEGLESGYLQHTLTEFGDKGLAVYSKGKFYPLTERGDIHTHYLRPLPEGTQVLKPGEVAVSEEELKHLRECKNKLSELETEYDRLHEEAMIWKYESGNT